MQGRDRGEAEDHKRQRHVLDLVGAEARQGPVAIEIDAAKGAVPVGLLEGGKVTSKTTEDLVKVIELEGEEWLLYKSFPLNVAVIRATTADENGNLRSRR